MENERSQTEGNLSGSKQMGVGIAHTFNITAIPKVSQAQKSIKPATGWVFAKKGEKGRLA